ncbi:hypothetical protein ACLB2K_071196 [Fragaria x ananassa]
MKLLNNEVGRLNMTQAYGMSVETVLTSILTHPQYKGITILSSYSPQHFASGDWNEGETCSGNVMPIGAGELVENKDTNKVMHEAQFLISGDPGFVECRSRVAGGAGLVIISCVQNWKREFGVGV